MTHSLNFYADGSLFYLLKGKKSMAVIKPSKTVINWRMAVITPIMLVITMEWTLFLFTK